MPGQILNAVKTFDQFVDTILRMITILLYLTLEDLDKKIKV